jgi:uncharacterized tellurite resistance protein B-like protein
MLNAIKNFFDNHIQDVGSQNEAAEEHRLKVATVALLLETARADFQIHDEELASVAHHAQVFFDLDADETTELVSLAEQESQNATCYYEFTSLINSKFTPEEKASIVELMWRIAYADKELEKYEEALVRKIAELLYVPHSAFIAAKHRVKSSLD